MELDVNEESTCKKKNHTHCTASCPTKKASYQTLQTTKMNPYTLLKTVRLASFQKPTIAIRFYLLQVCPSVPPFVLARLFISSFHVLRDYFFCFTQFGGSSYC